MEQSDTMRNLVAASRRRWYVIVASIVGAMLIAGVYSSMNAPEDTFTAAARLRLMNGLANVAGLPSQDSVIAAVSLPEVRESVAASLGARAVPAASAAINSKDTRVINVIVKASSPQLAEKGALAYATAARDRVLEDMIPAVDYQRSTIVQMRERVASLEKRRNELLDVLKSKNLDAATRLGYEQMEVTMETASFGPVDALRAAELSLAQYQRYVYIDGQPVASKVAERSLFTANLIRGAIIGLLVGVALAWALSLRDRSDRDRPDRARTAK